VDQWIDGGNGNGINGADEDGVKGGNAGSGDGLDGSMMRE
jgi:hypothetical protein